MKKVVLGYLTDGNFWQAKLYERDLNDTNALKFRNPSKLESHFEVLGCTKPNIPKQYDETILEQSTIQLSLELDCPVEYHKTASIFDYTGATQ
jgi:hypothetical protein